MNTCCDTSVAYEFFISFGIYPTQKLSSNATLLVFTYKVTQGVPIDLYSSSLITYAP